MIMFARIMCASLVHGSVKAVYSFPPTQVPRTVHSCTCTLHLADLLFVCFNVFFIAISFCF